MERLARILVPVDGSGASDQAVRFAAILADATGASVDILHVSYFDSSTDADEVSWLPECVAGPSPNASFASCVAHTMEEDARMIITGPG